MIRVLENQRRATHFGCDFYVNVLKGELVEGRVGFRAHTPPKVVPVLVLYFQIIIVYSHVFLGPLSQLLLFFHISSPLAKHVVHFPN